MWVVTGGDHDTNHTATLVARAEGCKKTDAEDDRVEIGSEDD